MVSKRRALAECSKRLQRGEEAADSCDEAMEDSKMSVVLQPQKRASADSRQIKVWVQGMRHTGSTLFFDFLRNAVLPEWQESTFALFEPCHREDKMRNAAAKGVAVEGDHTCGSLLSSVAKCDFSNIENLWGWDLWQPKGKYDPKNASEQCKGAALEVFKTIHVHDLQRDVLPILEENPNLYVIHIVRDLRAIWNTNMNFYSPEYLCATELKNLHAHHPRLLPLRYEDLVLSTPWAAAKIFDALGVRHDEDMLRRWRSTRLGKVDWDECEKLNEAGQGSSKICKHNNTWWMQPGRWERKLNGTQLELFNTPECREVLAKRHYHK